MKLKVYYSSFSFKWKLSLWTAVIPSPRQATQHWTRMLAQVKHLKHFSSTYTKLLSPTEIFVVHFSSVVALLTALIHWTAVCPWIASWKAGTRMRDIYTFVSFIDSQIAPWFSYTAKPSCGYTKHLRKRLEVAGVCQYWALTSQWPQKDIVFHCEAHCKGFFMDSLCRELGFPPFKMLQFVCLLEKHFSSNKLKALSNVGCEGFYSN